MYRGQISLNTGCTAGEYGGRQYGTRTGKGTCTAVGRRVKYLPGL